MAYIRLHDLKQYLGVTDESEDAILRRMIDSAQATFDSQFDFKFDATNGARYYQRGAFDWLPATPGLWAKPITYRRWVLYLDAPLLSLDWILLPGAVIVHPDEVIAYPLNSLPKHYIELKDGAPLFDAREDLIEVQGHWGYTENPPADAKQAVLRLAAYFYRQRDSQNQFSANTDVGSNNLAQDIPADVRSLISALQARYQLA